VPWPEQLCLPSLASEASHALHSPATASLVLQADGSGLTARVGSSGMSSAMGSGALRMSSGASEAWSESVTSKYSLAA
jgi:hypothetical protein